MDARDCPTGHRDPAVREMPACLSIGNDAGKSFVQLTALALHGVMNEGRAIVIKDREKLQRLAREEPPIQEVIPVKRRKRKACCKELRY
jgi:hypothetical protein